jgi:hypothetical protein
MILGAAAFAQWVRATPPAAGPSMRWVEAAPGGDYFLLRSAPGRADYRPAFLVNGATGRSVRVGHRVYGWVASASGRHAAWIESEVTQPQRLVRARLDGPEPLLSRVDVDAGGWPRALSDDGARVVLSSRERLRVRETGTGRQVAEAPIADLLAASFLAADAVRLYHTGPNRTLVVSDWNLRTGAVVERSRLGASFRVRVHDVRGRLLLVEERPGGAALAVYDAETGRRERGLIEDAGVIEAASWLSDGTAVVVTKGGGPSHLRLFDESGRETLSLDLPRRSVFWVGEAGETLVLGGHDAEPTPAADTLFVDRRSATVRVDADMKPAAFGRRALEPGVHSSRVLAPASADALRTRLLHGHGGGLFVFDADTSAKRALLPAAH